MRESSFTGLIPLWRTLREEGVTCLVTPALDYVGAIEIGTLDVRFASDDSIAGIGEGLRQFVSGLDDGTILHFLYRVELGGAEDDIREYESLCAGEGKSPALAAYVAGRAAWLRRQPLRKTRVYLFFSETSLTAASLTRGLLGAPLVFGNTSNFTQADHVARLQRLAQLRDRLLARLERRVPGHELDLDALWRLHFQLLNPNRSKSGAPPRASLRDNLFDPATIKAIGPHVAEYTEAEQLFNEDLEEGLGHFRQGNTFRRAATLKILPEGGTSYYGIEGFLEELRGDDGPIPYTLAVTVAVKHQAKARWALSTRHEFVVMRLLEKTPKPASRGDASSRRRSGALSTRPGRNGMRRSTSLRARRARSRLQGRRDRATRPRRPELPTRAQRRVRTSSSTRRWMTAVALPPRSSYRSSRTSAPRRPDRSPRRHLRTRRRRFRWRRAASTRPRTSGRR